MEANPEMLLAVYLQRKQIGMEAPSDEPILSIFVFHEENPIYIFACTIMIMQRLWFTDNSV